MANTSVAAKKHPLVIVIFFVAADSEGLTSIRND
jgi:hypothetical protein